MTKDEALKMAIEYAAKAGGLHGEQYYVARDKLINACKEALESQEPESDYVFVCKHCGDKLGIKWAEDVIGQVTINPKEEDATDNT